MAVNEKVCSIIERETGQKVDNLTSIQEILVDSLEFLDMLLIIGQELGKEVPDEKISHLMTVGDIIEAVS